MAVNGMLKGFDARGRIELPRFARDVPPMAAARSRPHRTPQRLERDQRRIRVLWNPKAGRKGGLPTNYSTFDTIVDLMGRNGLGEELIETASEEEAIEQAKDAVAHDYDVVVAAGGDGTIGLVGRQLLGTRCALGILPVGSVMNIPRMLGLSREMERAAEVISAGFVRAIDVGQVGDHIFYETASVAMYAAASRDLALVDDGDYGAILRSLEAAVRFRPSEMTIELDGDRTIETAALLVVVANGPYMGAGLTVAPEAIARRRVVRRPGLHARDEGGAHPLPRERRLRPTRRGPPRPDRARSDRAHHQPGTAPGARRFPRPRDDAGGVSEPCRCPSSGGARPADGSRMTTPHGDEDELGPSPDDRRTKLSRLRPDEQFL